MNGQRNWKDSWITLNFYGWTVFVIDDGLMSTDLNFELVEKFGILKQIWKFKENLEF